MSSHHGQARQGPRPVRPSTPQTHKSSTGPYSGGRLRDQSPNATLHPVQRSTRSRSSNPNPRGPSPYVGDARVRRPRNLYPPSPSVEDEAVGIAKEHPPQKPMDPFAVPNRGSPDQFERLEQVQFPTPEEPTSRKTCSRESRQRQAEHPHERDSMIWQNTSQSGGRKGQSSGSTTPREVKQSATPTSHSRSQSPAFWTPVRSDVSKTDSIDSGYHSVESKGNAVIEAFRRNERKRAGLDDDTPSKTKADVSSDEDDGSSTPDKRGDRTSAPYSYPGLAFKERISLRDSVIRAQPESPGGSVSQQSRPQQQTAERPSLGAQIRSAATSGGLAQGVYQSMAQTKKEPRRSFSYNAVPQSLRPGPSVAPSSQPRQRTVSPAPMSPSASLPRGSQSPKTQSPSNSRPSSPTSPYLSLRTDDGIRRATTFPTRPEAGTQRTSLLANSSMTIDEIPSPTGRGLSRPSSSVPYPCDGNILMPSEEDHRQHLRQASSILSSSPTKSRLPPLTIPKARPGMPETRHTSNAVSTLASASGAAVGGFSLPSSSISSPMKSRPGPTIRSNTRSCVQNQNVDNCRDWYTFEDGHDHQICPNCYESHFRESKAANDLTRTSRKTPHPTVACCFSSKWYRLAWRIIQDEQLEDLELFAKIARIDNASQDRCQRQKSIQGRCWTFRKFKDFHLCDVDAQKLKKLMPSIRDEMHEVRAQPEDTCALRQESTRFEHYTKLLASTDYDAHRNKRSPDLHNFGDLHKVLSSVPECARDSPLQGRHWHFPPQLRDFTICEECYATIIWPAIAAGSPVAKRVDRSPRTVHKEVEEEDADGRVVELHPGITCQLYSERMRKVFADAVRKEDFRLLKDRALERATKERHLQADFKTLQVRQALLMEKPDGPAKREQKRELDDQARVLAAKWLEYE